MKIRKLDVEFTDSVKKKDIKVGDLEERFGVGMRMRKGDHAGFNFL